MTDEGRALFRAMLTLFELLMAVFMEKRTTKNSRNRRDRPAEICLQGPAPNHA